MVIKAKKSIAAKKPVSSKKRTPKKAKPALKAKKVVNQKKAPKKKEVVREYRLHVLSKFSKRGKKPPIRYRRPVPNGMIKVALSIKSKRIIAGQILEFRYGKKQVQGQVGGWKHDPRPVILVFHDDKKKYVEGINTNYLSAHYLKKLRGIMNKFPGVDGGILYVIFKRTAKHAIHHGYRKYIRRSFTNTYLYVYEDERMRALDALAKQNISQFVGTSGSEAEAGKYLDGTK